jgi:hypothetical protein
MTTESPILLSNIDAKDIRLAKSWPTSLIEYANREGCAIGRLGQDHWGTNDERIPRPIAGTPDSREKFNGPESMMCKHIWRPNPGTQLPRTTAVAKHSVSGK